MLESVSDGDIIDGARSFSFLTGNLSMIFDRFQEGRYFFVLNLGNCQGRN